jgi:phage terminase large subunit-like protein
VTEQERLISLNNTINVAASLFRNSKIDVFCAVVDARFQVSDQRSENPTPVTEQHTL